MPLAELSLQDLRCIESARLEFGPGINLIYGANGAGKTSLLEAAFLLGRGRSFRTRLNERLIRHSQPFARVVGKTAPECTPERPPHTLGLEIRREGVEGGGTIARLDGGPVKSLADLATAFPVQALDPDAHKLIEDSAARRRRWLDWAVFHVEQGFAGAWSRYQRALLQRNAALRTGSREVAAWEPELAREGETMTAARERVMVALQPYWAEVSADLTGLDLTLGFQAGWDRSASLADALTLSTPAIGNGARRPSARTAPMPCCGPAARPRGMCSRGANRNSPPWRSASASSNTSSASTACCPPCCWTTLQRSSTKTASGGLSPG